MKTNFLIYDATTDETIAYLDYLKDVADFLEIDNKTVRKTLKNGGIFKLKEKKEINGLLEEVPRLVRVGLYRYNKHEDFS